MTIDLSTITIHEGQSGDWGFLTIGDEIVCEGHLDTIQERLIERLGIMVRRRVEIPDRPWKVRRSPEGQLTVADIFAMPDGDS